MFQRYWPGPECKVRDISSWDQQDGEEVERKVVRSQGLRLFGEGGRAD